VGVAYSHAGPRTLDAVLALPEDTSQRVELVGKQLMMSRAPGLAHQRASHRLFTGKSEERAKGSATQHRPKQLPQSACRSGWVAYEVRADNDDS
jgi:hypothetical protein